MRCKAAGRLHLITEWLLLTHVHILISNSHFSLAHYTLLTISYILKLSTFQWWTLQVKVIIERIEGFLCWKFHHKFLLELFFFFPSKPKNLNSPHNKVMQVRKNIQTATGKKYMLYKKATLYRTWFQYGHLLYSFQLPLKRLLVYKLKHLAPDISQLRQLADGFTRRT